jgi:hypothetical protein
VRRERQVIGEAVGTGSSTVGDFVLGGESKDEEISTDNGSLCTRYKEIVDTCCLLSPQYRPLVLLFDE